MYRNYLLVANPKLKGTSWSRDNDSFHITHKSLLHVDDDRDLCPFSVSQAGVRVPASFTPVLPVCTIAVTEEVI